MKPLFGDPDYQQLDAAVFQRPSDWKDHGLKYVAIPPKNIGKVTVEQHL